MNIHVLRSTEAHKNFYRCLKMGYTLYVRESRVALWDAFGNGGPHTFQNPKIWGSGPEL